MGAPVLNLGSILKAYVRKFRYRGQDDRDDWLATPDWFPQSLDHELNVTFIQMTRDRFRRSSFHNDAGMRAGDQMMRAPIDKLSGVKAGVPSHFILHTDACGSTLLTRYLEELPHCFILREPHLLAQLSRLPYSDAWPGWLATSLGLLGRAYPSDVATILKLHGFCNWMAGPILDSDPRTRIVFLYNPLRTHLLQILKTQQRRAVQHDFAKGHPMALVPALGEAISGELTDAQCTAATWLLNAHLCGRLLARPDADRVLVMSGQELFSEPRQAVRAVAEHFGLRDEETRAALDELRPATRHAKAPGKAYDDAMRAADLAAAEQRCGPDVEAGIAWALELCPELIGVFDGARDRARGAGIRLHE